MSLPISPTTTAKVGPARAVSTAVTCLLGAGIIHFGLAPEHFVEEPTHGMFFLVAAIWQWWTALVLLYRPTSAQWLSASLTNVALIALWATSRSIGVPVRGTWVREAIGFADIAAVLLEFIVIAIVLVIVKQKKAVRLPPLAIGGPLIIAVSIGVLFLPSAHH